MCIWGSGYQMLKDSPAFFLFLNFALLKSWFLVNKALCPQPHSLKQHSCTILALGDAQQSALLTLKTMKTHLSQNKWTDSVPLFGYIFNMTFSCNMVGYC